MMDDLFKLANKYSMLEDDVRATTQRCWLPVDLLEMTMPKALSP